MNKTDAEILLAHERRGAEREKLEAVFVLQMLELHQRLGVRLPEREVRFHPTRRWKFDFAWPELKIAVEVEGGVWSSGRHTRGAGFIADCEKYNEAARLGWRVFRMPGPWILGGRGARYVERVLCGEEAEDG